MNPYIKKLEEIAGKKERRIIGLMSGTSMDGLDIVLGRFSGSGQQTAFKLEKFYSAEYSQKLKYRLLVFKSAEQLDTEHICVWHTKLAHLHAGFVNDALEIWGIEAPEIDLIASHGQTLYHAPEHKHKMEGFPNSTMQIGDGDHMAHLTRVITVSDFRQRDTARGNEGAPLAGYGDYLLFSEPQTHRVMLNIGGIANFTWLPAGERNRFPPVCCDTGPGNTLIDAVVREYFEGMHYDKDGGLAASGEIHQELLDRLKSHPYFRQPLPKTTGFEVFHLNWVNECIEESGYQLRAEDLLATLTQLTVETISDEIRRILPEKEPVELYVSGGGVHNKTLMKSLEEALQPAHVMSLDELGVDPDAKEALMFAAFANELVCGTDTRLHLGKLSFPG